MENNDTVLKKAEACILCNAKFKTTKELKVHCQLEHLVGLKCEVCQKHFSSSLTLEAHLKEVHQKKSELLLNKCEVHQHKSELLFNKCEVCKKHFSSSLTLEAHRQEVHQLLLNKCEVCQKHFSSSLTLEVHLQKEHQQKSELLLHKCESCLARFTTHQGFSSHSCQGCKCEICQEHFPTKASLDAHSKVHIKKPKPVVKRIRVRQPKKSKLNLEHLHPNANLYDCTECKLQFGTAIGLQSHARLAHEKAGQETIDVPDDKPIKCEMCKESFGADTDLNDHLKSDHQIYKRDIAGMGTLTYSLREVQNLHNLLPHQ